LVDVTDPGKSFIYPPQKYGQLICIPLIEKSNTPKARILAMNQCRTCIELVGLNAIGKKGILAVSKSLSSETLTEIRTACLDIFEAVLKRMNGDVQKLFRVCGKSNISHKAKNLVEERWARHNPSQMSFGHPEAGNNESKPAIKSKRSSISPTPRAKSNRAPSSSSKRRNTTIGLSSKISSLNLDGEDLVREKKEFASVLSRPFTFSYNPKNSIGDKQSSIDVVSSVSRFDRRSFSTPQRKSFLESKRVSPKPLSFRTVSESNLPNHSMNSTENESSLSSTPRTDAAASLRARLQHIRDKHRNTPGKTLSDKNIRHEMVKPQLVNGQHISSIQFSTRHEVPISATESISDFFIFKDISDLLDSSDSLKEKKRYLSRATDALRKLHASISKTSNYESESEANLMKEIRNDVVQDTSKYTTLLTRYVVHL